MTSKEKMKAGGTSSEDSRSKPAVEQMAPRQSPRKKPPAHSEHSDISMLLYVAEEMMLREQQEAKKIAEQIVAERKAAKDKGAAAPMKKKPVSTTRRQKISLKHLQAQEEIAIDVLQGLSDRMLRELFSIKSTSNDYTPHFSYICAFYADGSKCTQTFKGFRDETKVFEHLEAHIREHVNEEAKKEKKKKTMASAKKEKCSSPKSTKTDTATTMENQTSSQSNDKASKKRKVQDDKENQTCSITDKESETSAKKKIRRSESSESSESGVPVEVEVKKEICFVKMPHADHTYAAVAEHQRPATPPSPSSLSDRSFSSGSFEEPGSPSEDEEAKVILSGDPLATKEEIVSDTVDQELHEDSACKKEVKAKGLNVRRKKMEEIPEEIKKLALEYIEELQSKKKDENFQLVCKICNNGKVFTAAASLINHYRSHAGIKLFKCELCESSYTRKHSLNYHMLIHAGKFIIDCKYCGRWFRHRSHHKEHLRKHTGETPYECLECSPCIKYKTRNTYKRHLRTHHGKILSKFGTIMMSEEEFAKVRTKKYKKSASSDASHHRQKSPPSSAESSPNREEPPQLPSTSSTPLPSVPLPPVGTILSGLSPMTTQPSLGILPPMGAIQAAAAAPVAVLGVPNMVCHASVYPTYSSPLSAPITLMPQASFSMGQPGITVCQPSVTVSTDSQGQTFYTITGFAPMVPTESAAPVYTSHSVQGQTGGAREMDMADYKPVGYVTHN